MLIRKYSLCRLVPGRSPHSFPPAAHGGELQGYRAGPLQGSAVRVKRIPLPSRSRQYPRLPFPSSSPSVCSSRRAPHGLGTEESADERRRDCDATLHCDATDVLFPSPSIPSPPHVTRLTPSSVFLVISHEAAGGIDSTPTRAGEAGEVGEEEGQPGGHPRKKRKKPHPGRTRQ